MKRIEKLAHESLKEFGYPARLARAVPGGDPLGPLVDEWNNAARAAYEAGFRKAREMAYDLMKRNSDKRIFALDVDIENLGEEEA